MEHFALLMDYDNVEWALLINYNRLFIIKSAQYDTGKWEMGVQKLRKNLQTSVPKCIDLNEYTGCLQLLWLKMAYVLLMVKALF